MWFQLIDIVKEQKKPVIFVTDDNKDDWWLTSQGKTLRPHPALGQEMFERTGQQFYAYSMSGFVEWFAKYHDQPLAAELLGDIQQVERERGEIDFGKSEEAELWELYPNNPVDTYVWKLCQTTQEISDSEQNPDTLRVYATQLGSIGKRLTTAPVEKEMLLEILRILSSQIIPLLSRFVANPPFNAEQERIRNDFQRLLNVANELSKICRDMDSMLTATGLLRIMFC